MNVFATDEIWRFALAAIPLAVIVAVACRCLPCRPSTRHTLWLTLLVLFILAPFLPRAPVPDLAALAGGEIVAAYQPQAAADGQPVTIGRIEKDHSAPDQSGSLAGKGTRDSGDSAPSSSLGDPWRTFMLSPPPWLSATANIRTPDRPEASVPPRTSGVESTGDPPGGRQTAPAPPAGAPRRALAGGSAPLRQTDDDTGHRSADGAAPGEGPLAAGIASAQPPEVMPGGEDPADLITGGKQPASNAADCESAWALWLVHLRTIRDAVMSLPPIPTSIWAGGAAFLVLLTIARAARFRRLLASAAPAPTATVRCVSEAASALGLRRAPIALMVADRISPMVWCGRRPRLLLPGQLWRQLDEVGRRAVIYHELAHLRRRDHLVCYLAIIVGWLYWWHPVVWWARRQLREEADLCCDVWVTSLMPGARRAYATALLEARKYTSGFHPADPVAGLGVSTTRAKRFARRLTMVMSHQLTPKLTFAGVLMACTLAAGSWLVTPTLACPPKEKQASPPCGEADKLAEAPKAPKAPVFLVSASAPPAPAAPPALLALPAPPSYQATAALEKLIKLHGGGDRGEMSLEERIQLLEEQLDMFMQHLEQWTGTIDFESFEMPEMPELAEIPELSQISEYVVHHPELQAALKAVPQTATSAYEQAVTVYRSALGASGGDKTAGLTVAPQKTETRTYELPKGKLEALTQLMVRQDVPVYVSPGEDSITVHGTPMQHIIFQAFCTMINGEDQVKQYPLSEGKLEALSELMIRPDVPILVSPGDAAIELHGTDLEQHVFDAFIKMIEPDKADAGHAGISIGVVPAPPKAPKAAKAPAAKGKTKAKAGEYELKAVAQLQELKKLEAMLKSLEKQALTFEEKSGQLREKAEALEEKAEALEEEAEEMEKSAFEAEGAARVRAIQRVNELMLKALQLENEARMLEANADEIEARAEALDEKMEEVEEQIEAIEEAIEDQEEEEDDH